MGEGRLWIPTRYVLHCFLHSSRYGTLTLGDQGSTPTFAFYECLTLCQQKFGQKHPRMFRCFLSFSLLLTLFPRKSPTPSLSVPYRIQVTRSGTSPFQAVPAIRPVSLLPASSAGR